MIYLIEYDWRAGHPAKLTTYLDTQRLVAEDARLSLELSLHERGIEREVVLLQAADEQSLRRTHGRYFESLETTLAHAVDS